MRFPFGPPPLPPGGGSAAVPSSSAGTTSTGMWKSSEITSARIESLSSRNMMWPSLRYSTSGSFWAMPRRWMPSRM